MRSITLLLLPLLSAALALPVNLPNVDTTSGLAAAPKIGIPVDHAPVATETNGQPAVRAPRFPPGFTSADPRDASARPNLHK